jgi:hypothetical protein
MKKTLFIGILFSLALCANAQFQKSVKYVTCNLEANDTLRITKTDKIVAITVSVPASATDSVHVSGDTQGYLGRVPAPIVFGPGESFSVGYDDQVRINKLTIIVKDKARIILIPAKD